MQSMSLASLELLLLIGKENELKENRNKSRKFIAILLFRYDIPKSVKQI